MQDIAEIKTYAQKNDVPIIKDDSIDFLCGFIKKNHIKKILEIGTAIGYSAIQFAKISSDIQVVTIEIDIDRYLRAKQNIQDVNLTQQISAFNEDALRFETDDVFDLIFIDAAKAQYIKFFEKFKKNLAPSGVIISDNLAFHGMVDDISLTKSYSTIKLIRKIKKYLSFLKLNPEFNTEFYSFGDGISVSRKNPIYTPRSFSFLQEETHFLAKRLDDSENAGDYAKVFRKKEYFLISQIYIFNDDQTRTHLKSLLLFIEQKACEFGFHSMCVEKDCGGLSKDIWEDLGFFTKGNLLEFRF